MPVGKSNLIVQEFINFCFCGIWNYVMLHTFLFEAHVGIAIIKFFLFSSWLVNGNFLVNMIFRWMQAETSNCETD